MDGLLGRGRLAGGVTVLKTDEHAAWAQSNMGKYFHSECEFCEKNNVSRRGINFRGPSVCAVELEVQRRL